MMDLWETAKMLSNRPNKKTAAQHAAGEERRKDFRIGTQLLLDYRLLGETRPPRETVSDEEIANVILKPTADLLARLNHSGSQMTLVVPWLMKMDWALELVFKTLNQLAPGSLPLPQMTDVNVSASGLRFNSPRRFSEGDHLEVVLILPPFIPVRAFARVVRTVPTGSGNRLFSVATRFTAIKPEDQETLVHYIFTLQSEQLRSRYPIDQAD